MKLVIYKSHSPTDAYLTIITNDKVIGVHNPGEIPNIYNNTQRYETVSGMAEFGLYDGRAVRARERAPTTKYTKT